MTTFKSNSSKRPMSKRNPKLVQGWLLKEVAHNVKDGSFNMGCMKTILCLLAGQMTMRKLNKEESKQPELVAQLAGASLMILTTIHDSLEDDYMAICERIRNSDELYIQYIEYLYSLAEKKIKAGDQLNDIFSNCNEIRKWKSEEGFIYAPQQPLKDGWMHPLSESRTIDGKNYVCVWGFSSAMCAAACGRILTEDNGNEAILTLIRLGVLEPEKMDAELQICAMLDNEYLKLVSRAKEALENRLNK